MSKDPFLLIWKLVQKKTSFGSITRMHNTLHRGLNTPDLLQSDHCHTKRDEDSNVLMAEKESYEEIGG